MAATDQDASKSTTLDAKLHTGNASGSSGHVTPPKPIASASASTADAV